MCAMCFQSGRLSGAYGRNEREWVGRPSASCSSDRTGQTFPSGAQHAGEGGATPQARRHPADCGQVRGHGSHPGRSCLPALTSTGVS